MSLFTAVEENNLELLDALLYQPNINVNLTNSTGETALTRSIRLKRSAVFVKRLLELGCDPNIPNKEEETALYLAIFNDSIDVVKELIDSGANLNVQDADEGTPLYYAVFFNSLELVCMLLCNGADVRASSKCNQTPLMIAFLMENPAIITTLINYYYEFSDLQHFKGHVVTRLSREWLNCEDILMLEFSLLNGNVETFKLVWSRVDHKKFLHIEKSFLVQYIFKCVFAPHDWLEGLFLILSSPCAMGLIEQYHVYVGNYLIIDLLDILSEKGIERENIITVIYVCLSIGVKINSHDIEWVFEFYGYSEKLEALIYAGSYSWCDLNIGNHSLIHTILSLQHDYSSRQIFSYFQKRIHYTDDPNDIICWLKFFALSAGMKSELVRCFSPEKQKLVSELLWSMPEFPSLLELCRNRVQKSIRKLDHIKKTYQFHDIVKKLSLPKQLKEVLLFKRPIYECAYASV